MNDLNNLYFLLLFIIEQIFMFLKDLLILRLMPVSTVNDESSNYKLPGDLVIFLLIFIGLVVLLIVRARCLKDREIKSRFPPFIREDQLVLDDTSSVSQDDSFSVSDMSVSRMNICKHPYGDRIFSEEADIPRSHLFLQSQLAQDRKSLLQAPRKFRGWLVRKTRSGHVYGIYRF